MACMVERLSGKAFELMMELSEIEDTPIARTPELQDLAEQTAIAARSAGAMLERATEEQKKGGRR